MASEKDAGEDIGMRRRRLRYRAWHRGTRELDLLLGPFADASSDAMPGAELDAFEALLSEEDTAITAWLLGRETPPEVRKPLIDRLIAFRQSAAAQQ